MRDTGNGRAGLQSLGTHNGLDLKLLQSRLKILPTPVIGSDGVMFTRFGTAHARGCARRQTRPVPGW